MMASSRSDWYSSSPASSSTAEGAPRNDSAKGSWGGSDSCRARKAGFTPRPIACPFATLSGRSQSHAGAPRGVSRSASSGARSRASAYSCSCAVKRGGEGMKSAAISSASAPPVSASATRLAVQHHPWEGPRAAGVCQEAVLQELLGRGAQGRVLHADDACGDGAHIRPRGMGRRRHAARHRPPSVRHLPFAGTSTRSPSGPR